MQRSAQGDGFQWLPAVKTVVSGDMLWAKQRKSDHGQAKETFQMAQGGGTEAPFTGRRAPGRKVTSVCIIDCMSQSRLMSFQGMRDVAKDKAKTLAEREERVELK